MTRPSHIWLTFALCSVVLLGVMGWVSLTTLQLDHLQFEAAQTAEIEERARLALWRMDSWLAPLIIEESARSITDYEAFPAAPRAYTKGYAQLKQGDVLVPSPLLDLASSNVLLHFQYYPDGRVSSPQAPTGHQRDLAVASYTTDKQIELAEQRLAAFRSILGEPVTGAPASPRATDASLVVERAQTAALPPVGDNNGDFLIQQTELPLSNGVLAQVSAPPDDVQQGAQAFLNVPAQLAQVPGQMAQQQSVRNAAEFNYRANTFQQAQQRLSVNNLKAQFAEPQPLSPPAPTATSIDEGVFKALWLGDALVLARRVNLGNSFVIQGVWLNWTNVQTALLDSIRDLFPAAKLLPLREPDGERNARMLAALPVKLLPGPMPKLLFPAWTPLRISLLIAWACVLVAGLAVGLLLYGALSLSERRASFVSAVTHELRTPLTTFKMYSEMLAEDMVPDTAKRRQYLNTLCSEANRLSHLVENVLAYARLERGSARRREEKISLGDLIERVKPRLRQRAAQVGMALADEVAAPQRQTVVHVDVTGVEQILFNLVDNACKYAVPGAAEKIIHLEALPGPGRLAILRVRDHGQGISAETARNLFKPFGKSAQQAASSAPGVGLGLALCRRLSRSMGGDLQWDTLVKDGAGFILSLPVSPSA